MIDDDRLIRTKACNSGKVDDPQTPVVGSDSSLETVSVYYNRINQWTAPKFQSITALSFSPALTGWMVKDARWW